MASDTSKYRKPTIYSPEEAPSIAPGPFFIYTSNVDSFFHLSGFKKWEIREVHGSVDIWQCVKPCKQNLWRAPPPPFEFEVDPDTLLAPQTRTKALPTPASTSTSDQLLPKGFETNHPTCIHCNEKSRPNVLMFDDTQWICDRVVLETYMTWETVVGEIFSKKDAVLLTSSLR